MTQPIWDEQTLAALDGSIAKWERIVTGVGADKGTENCPLCAEFYDAIDPGADPDDWQSESCLGCPVAHAVDNSCCADTPFEAWAREARAEHGNSRSFYARTPRLVELAQAELDFLRSLRPQPEVQSQPEPTQDDR